MKEEITVEEKIAVIETLIESVRWARPHETAPEHRTWRVLRAIAADIRAERPEAPSAALDQLSFQVDVARRTKARIGYVEMGQHQAVSECLMAFWTVVRKALERADKQGAAPNAEVR